MSSSKKLIFTICCNNYLAQALTLGDSVKSNHPEVEFIIGLVDEPRNEIDYRYKVIPVKEAVESKALAHMSKNYDITELCTAVKPHYFEYFFKNSDAKQVIYLDPDIIVFSSLEELFRLSENHSVIVTPHFCSPTGNGRFSGDIRVLSGGIYNLGFISISNHPNASMFLAWWKEKSLNEFYVNIEYFTDQLWANCVTCFCPDAYVLRHLGYNMANWNLHERYLSSRDGKFYVNDSIPLVFFHYSHYSPDRPHQMTSLDKSILLSERPDIIPVYEVYRERLKQNNFDHYKTIKPVYFKKSVKILPQFVRKFMVRVCVKTLLILKHG